MKQLPKKPQGWASPSEKAKLILLIFFTVVLAVVLFSDVLDQVTERPEEVASRVPRVDVAKVTPDPEILAEIQDEFERQRVRREEKPFQHLLATANRLVPGALEYSGLPESPLDYDALLADPKAFRGKPVWVQARLEEDPLTLPYQSLKGVHDVRGKVRDEKGRLYVFSMAQPARHPLQKGDWVKIKGFFFKLWDPELVGGKVPYIVGRHLYRTWPAWEPVREPDPALFFEIMEGSPLDPEETEPEAFYHMLSYAMHLPEEEIAGENVLRLDEITLTRLRNDPGGSRARKTRFFAQVLQPPLIRAADENPLGLKWITRAWVGSNRPLGAFKVILPGRITELEKGREVEIVGVFLRNMEYIPADARRGTVSAPIFLAARSRFHEPIDSGLPESIKWGIGIGTLLAIATILFLLSRDRRAHAETMSSLAARRKARLASARDKKGSAPPSP